MNTCITTYLLFKCFINSIVTLIMGGGGKSPVINHIHNLPFLFTYLSLYESLAEPSAGLSRIYAALAEPSVGLSLTGATFAEPSAGLSCNTYNSPQPSFGLSCNTYNIFILKKQTLWI
jgi:hypothetical protein